MNSVVKVRRTVVYEDVIDREDYGSWSDQQIVNHEQEAADLDAAEDERIVNSEVQVTFQ